MRWFSMYRSSGSVIQYSINKGVLRKRGSIYIYRFNKYSLLH